MSSGETRYDYRVNLPGDDLRLEKVQRQIAKGEAGYQQLLALCSSVQIDIPRFFELANQYGGQDAVKEAIRNHGSDYELHLIVSAQEEEEARDPNLKTYHDGWLAHREEEVAGREEALQRSKHG